jgi:hypothetical protein
MSDKSFIATLVAVALLPTGCTATPPTGPKMEQSANKMLELQLEQLTGVRK